MKPAIPYDSHPLMTSQPQTEADAFAAGWRPWSLAARSAQQALGRDRSVRRCSPETFIPRVFAPCGCCSNTGAAFSLFSQVPTAVDGLGCELCGGGRLGDSGSNARVPSALAGRWEGLPCWAGPLAMASNPLAAGRVVVFSIWWPIRFPVFNLADCPIQTWRVLFLAVDSGRGQRRAGVERLNKGLPSGGTRPSEPCRRVPGRAGPAAGQPHGGPLPHRARQPAEIRTITGGEQAPRPA